MDITNWIKEIDRLKAENANLAAAVRGKTFFHSDTEVNAEMGRLRAEVERLTNACKAWELQAKGYGKVIDHLDGDELRQLEQSIAYSGARSDIECWCQGINYSGANSGTWYDTNNLESDEEKEMVGDAVRYLELRGLLKRHPDNAKLVKPVDAEAVRG